MVDPVVLPLSRGGLAVAAEVARCLDAELAGGAAPGRPPGATSAARTAGRTVVLVDDGLATGDSALTAVREGWTTGAARVVLATPVCAPRAAASLRPVVDDLVCLGRPWYFRSVADWYDDFHRPSDHELAEALTPVRGSP
jgi:putative phosphoribosyl transferase